MEHPLTWLYLRCLCHVWLLCVVYLCEHVWLALGTAELVVGMIITPVTTLLRHRPMLLVWLWGFAWPSICLTIYYFTSFTVITTWLKTAECNAGLRVIPFPECNTVLRVIASPECNTILRVIASPECNTGLSAFASSEFNYNNDSNGRVYVLGAFSVALMLTKI